MFGEKRLLGSIDQPESRIYFQHAPTSAADASAAAAGDAAAEEGAGAADSAGSLRAFDAQIEHICRSVELVSNAIVAKHPEFVAIAAPQA